MAALGNSIDPDGTGDYLSLNALESAQQQDLTDGGGDTYTATCESSSGTSDTLLAFFNGWTTGVANYILIKAKSGDEAVKTGLDTSRYLLDVITSGIVTRENYLRIDGLQIRCTVDAATIECIKIDVVDAGNDIRISNCRLIGDSTGTNYCIRSVDADAIVQVWNTIADTAFDCIHAGSPTSFDIYNSIIMNSQFDGIEFDGGTGSVTNCAVFNNPDDFDIAGGATVTIDHCASDDNDGTNNVAESGGGANWPDDFVDAGAGDFTLKGTSNLVDAGADNPSSGLYTTDMEGDAYNVGGYSLGVDEIEAGGTIYNVSIAESTGLSETQAVNLTMPITIAESVGLSETQAITLDIPATVSESIGLTDTQSATLDMIVAIAESIGLSDTQSIGANIFDVSVSESIGLSDTQSATFILTVAVAEGIGLSDVQSTVMEYTVSIVETFGLTDIQTSGSLATGKVCVTISGSGPTITITGTATTITITGSAPSVDITGEGC